ncbi:MAG: hypothetical protein KUG77_03875 [Nannocystaceae bacterium]|nr:hypothetical protein [Nannocystaceae bacterium]
MRALTWVPLFAVLACRPELASPPTAVLPPDPVIEDASPPAAEQAAAPDGCTPFVEEDVVLEAYLRGVAKLDESRDGEHYRAQPFDVGVGALKVAATNGHLKAQSLYGRTLFGVMFSRGAPSSEEREAYVTSVVFLRVAAKAGESQAEGYLPGLTADSDAALEPPLGILPEGWVEEAFERADKWIQCHGLPTPSAG